MGYEWIEHTADVAVKVWGKDVQELFSEAAKALFSVITDIEKVTPKFEERIEAEGEGVEGLLVGWLNELLYLHEVKGMLFSQFEPKLTKGRVEGKTRGEPFDPSRHEILTPVKAVTYHGLELKREEGHWEATLIFDV